ncbi:MAG: MEDS domain-containing protein [Deltaproteobacteria bacterium]|nr:MEDS domain-containing protein [Deltaproteobacteria bacterium]
MHATTPLRDSGIDRIGQMPWGTHLCQFYRDKDDLLDILVPYFKAGLESNECCMWVTSDPLGVDEATSALGAVVPDLDRHLADERIQILPYDHWYLRGGHFDMRRVLDGWKARVDEALARGFDGVRVTGNTAWLEAAHWADFTEYEDAINGVIRDLPVLVACTYGLGRCGATEIIDVVGTHQFALVHRGGRWEAVESTERRRVAEALREREHRLRLLFENLSSGCVYHRALEDGGRTVDYVLLEVNAAFERMAGLRRDQILGRRAGEVMPAVHGVDWVSMFQRVAGAAEPVRLECRSGLRTYSVLAYSPAPGFFVTLFDDVTERRKAEEQREDFLRAVSHDLRTPLSAISLSAQSLLRRPDPEVLPRRLNRIVNACEHMTATLDDLSEIARLDSGPVPLKRRAVDLGRFGAELVARLAGALDTSRITITIPEDLPAVDADPDRLERIVVNLLSNALKYSTPGSEVRLDCGRDGDRVAISITDRGAGIVPEDLPHVFDRFFRTKAARATGVQGLGIGLYITRALVEAHGGSITAESEPGRGSCFRVVLPAAS